MILSRSASALALFAAALAAGWALGGLGLLLTHAAWRTPDDGPDPRAVIAAPSDTAPAAPAAWPALFGTRSDTAPDTAAPARVATDYVLTGLAIGAAQSWAMISDGERNSLVQPGDALSGGETVLEIAADGVRIERGEEVLLVSFPDTETLTTLAAGGGVRRTGTQIRTSFGIEEFRGRDMRQVLMRAGGVRLVEAEDGAPAQEILWVRPGQLYDRAGLQKGDRVLTINGIAAGDGAALSAGIPELLRAREFTLEIVRGGRVRSLQLTVRDDGN